MNILITCAGGFVGRALLDRLLSSRRVGNSIRLTVVEVHLSEQRVEPNVRWIEGSISDPRCIDESFRYPVDAVIHLASIPGGMADQRYELSCDVNVLGMIRLLDAARAQQNRPRLVFASSIAVFGSALLSAITDFSPLLPQMTYGAQSKLSRCCRRARIRQQRKQMMERRSRLRYDRPARCRTGGGGEVKSNKAFGKRVANARDNQPPRHHPVAEMCDASKRGPNGTPYIASVCRVSMYEVVKLLSGPFNSQSRRARCAEHASADMVISRRQVCGIR